MDEDFEGQTDLPEELDGEKLAEARIKPLQLTSAGLAVPGPWPPRAW